MHTTGTHAHTNMHTTDTHAQHSHIHTTYTTHKHTHNIHTQVTWEYRCRRKTGWKQRLTGVFWKTFTLHLFQAYYCYTHFASTWEFHKDTCHWRKAPQVLTDLRSRISGSVMRVLVMWVWTPLRPCHEGPWGWKRRVDISMTTTGDGRRILQRVNEVCTHAHTHMHTTDTHTQNWHKHTHNTHKHPLSYTNTHTHTHTHSISLSLTAPAPPATVS